MRSTPPRHPTDDYWSLPPDEDVNYTSVAHYEEVKRLLRTHFQRPRFLPRQLAAINAAVTNYDLILSLPTSAGKSLCFQLPALLDKRLTVVVSPAIALIEDQINSLYNLGEDWKKLAIRSHTQERQNPRTYGSRLFYICPEWTNTDSRRALLYQLCREGRVSRFVIDEAHEAVRFPRRPAYERILHIRQEFPDIPFTIVSASITREDIKALTNNLSMSGTCVRANAPLDRPNLHYRVVHVPRGTANYRVRAIATHILDHPDDCGLVFVRTRRQAEAVAEKLRSIENIGSVVDYYHGGEKGRLPVLLDKFYSGATKVVVCTCAFGQGIDKPNIRFVFHYTLPPNIPSYFQETGRAGRDNLTSHCILFYSFSDIRTIANIVALEQLNGERKLTYEQQGEIQRVLSYCNDSLSCRRVHILDPFENESIKDDWLRNLSKFRQNGVNCKACDVCDHHAHQDRKKSFKMIDTKHLKAVENAFQNDPEQTIKTLASRMCSMTGIGLTVFQAEGILESLAAAGYLKIRFKYTGKGFNIYVTLGPSILEVAYRSEPIPHTIKLTRVPPRKGTKWQSKAAVHLKEHAGTSDEESDDEILPADSEHEDHSSDEEAHGDSVAINMRAGSPSILPLESIEPLSSPGHVARSRLTRNRPLSVDTSVYVPRKRLRRAFESPRPAPGLASESESDAKLLVGKFRSLAKKKLYKHEQKLLKGLSDSIIRKVFENYMNYFDDEDEFLEEFRKLGASEEIIDILEPNACWIMNDILHDCYSPRRKPHKGIGW